MMKLVAAAQASAPTADVLLQPVSFVTAVIDAKPGGRGSEQMADDARSHTVRAAAIYRFRRRRDALFGKGLFADPAWDILLDLYVAHAANRRVCVSSACIAASAPATTALRWIKVLERAGLIIRSSDAEDARIVYVSLSSDALRKLNSLIGQSRG
jgi:DNA-binding MarR family transcriptional regulator